MAPSTLDVLLSKFSAYSAAHGIVGGVVFHGGEPLLFGRRRMVAALEHDGFRSGRLRPYIQTNATLVDEAWVDIFEHYNVSVSISLDGDARRHDRFRRDVRGRGTYDQVRRALHLLTEAGVPVAGLAVVDPESNGAAVIQHFSDLGIRHIDLLPPISTHYHQKGAPVDLEGVRRFLVSAFLEWYLRDDPSVHIRLFESFVRGLHQSGEGYFGTGMRDWARVAVIETNGDAAALEEFEEVERVDGRTYYRTGLNILTDALEDIHSDLVAFYASLGVDALPTECMRCEHNDVCSGGNCASRYSGHGDFDNPGVHCPSFYDLAGLIKELYARTRAHAE